MDCLLNQETNAHVVFHKLLLRFSQMADDIGDQNSLVCVKTKKGKFVTVAKLKKDIEDQHHTPKDNITHICTQQQFIV